MKKIYSILICGLLCITTLYAQNVTEGTTGSCTWTLTGTAGNYTLTVSGTGIMRNYPNASGAPWYAYRDGITTVNITQGVTSVGDYAFGNGPYRAISSVTLPGSITHIGEYAFAECTALTSVAIPENVITIGGSAFANAGITSLTIPENVTSIGYFAFFKCNRLTSVRFNATNCTFGGAVFKDSEGAATLVLGNQVTRIPDAAFTGWVGLTSVNILGSVTSIGESAFGDCTALTSINMPESVITIGSYAFANTGVASITIPENVISIGACAFSRCSKLTEVYYNAADCVFDIGYGSPKHVFYGSTGQAKLTIGNRVTRIPDEAFMYWDGLTSVSIPSSVTVIGNYAFNQTALTSVVIPNSVTEIGTAAFLRTGLVSVTISESVVTIGSNAFAVCEKLAEVRFNAVNCTAMPSAFSNSSESVSATLTVGNGVTQILDRAFGGWTGLSSVTLPEGVTSIGANAFATTSLKSITIPASVSDIYVSNAFYLCEKLTSIEVAAGNTHYSSVGGILFNGDKTTLLKYPAGKQGAYTIPNGVTGIGAWAFTEDCTGIPSVTFPASITSFGSLPPCVAAITVPSTVPPAGCPTVFQPSSVRLNVPQGSEAAYSAATGWKNFYIEGISALPGGTCGPNLTWSYDMKGKLTISGTGEMTSYPWANLQAKIQTLSLPNGLTSITGHAFGSCTALVSVNIPGSVATIGNNAFLDCKRLASVTFGSGVKDIGDYAFKGCTGLTSVTTGNSVTRIGGSAFSGCTGLITANIGSGIIHDAVFDGCTSLASITFGEGVTEIRCAFNNCPSLAEVHFNAIDCSIYSCTSGVGPWVSSSSPFAVCPAFTKLTFGSNVTRIPSAFFGCTSITSVTIPESVTKIDGSAFYGTGLTSITIPENVTVIGSFAFAYCPNLATVHFNAVNCTDVGAYSINYGYQVAFAGSPVTSLTIGAKVKQIPARAFCNFGLISVTIPESVTYMGNHAFSGCTSLASVDFNAVNCETMSEEVYLYGSYRLEPVFSGCTALNAVRIGSRVTRLPDYSFYGCSGLASVTIPAGITVVGDRAFGACTGLSSVTVLNSVPPTANAEAFYNVNVASARLNVPQGSENSYRTANVWKDFGTIGVASGSNCALASLSVSAGTLTPAFNTSVTSYTCTLPNSVNSLTITATTADGGATVTGAGTKTLTAAEHTFPVTVTSQNGLATTTYTIVVNRKPVFTVTFDSQGGSTVAPQTILQGEKATNPATPTRTGYAFDGWYKESACATAWVFATDVVAANTTLYAGWSESGVASVKILPATIAVRKGTIQQFSASVTVVGGVSQSVTWSLSGNALTATNISSAGLLTVAAGETATALTVTATSVYDNTKKGTATVTVAQEGMVSVSGTVANAPAGTRVELYGASSIKSGVPSGYQYVNFTVTDSNHGYLFDNLSPGVYIVLVALDGYDPTPSDAMNLTGGTFAGTVDFTVDNNAHTVTPGNTNTLTGTKDLFAPDMKVYPNPFMGVVHLTGAEGCMLRIFTESGAAVHVQKVVNSDEIIWLEQLPAGVYFFRLENNGRTKMMKVIKSN